MNAPQKFSFNRFGLAEDPRGAQVAWTINGRRYLADVVGVYRREFPAATMLKVRHFNGEDAPDVAAAAVELIGWSSSARIR